MLHPLFESLCNAMKPFTPEERIQWNFELAKKAAANLKPGHVFNVPETCFQAQNSSVFGRIVVWYEPIESLTPDGQIALAEGDFAYYKKIN